MMTACAAAFRATCGFIRGARAHVEHFEKFAKKFAIFALVKIFFRLVKL